MKQVVFIFLAHVTLLAASGVHSRPVSLSSSIFSGRRGDRAAQALDKSLAKQFEMIKTRYQTPTATKAPRQLPVIFGQNQDYLGEPLPDNFGIPRDDGSGPGAGVKGGPGGEVIPSDALDDLDDIIEGFDQTSNVTPGRQKDEFRDDVIPGNRDRDQGGVIPGGNNDGKSVVDPFGKGPGQKGGEDPGSLTRPGGTRIGKDGQPIGDDNDADTIQAGIINPTGPVNGIVPGDGNGLSPGTGVGPLGDNKNGESGQDPRVRKNSKHGIEDDAMIVGGEEGVLPVVVDGNGVPVRPSQRDTDKAVRPGDGGAPGGKRIGSEYPDIEEEPQIFNDEENPGQTGGNGGGDPVRGVIPGENLGQLSKEPDGTQGGEWPKTGQHTPGIRSEDMPNSVLGTQPGGSQAIIPGDDSGRRPGDFGAAPSRFGNPNDAVFRIDPNADLLGGAQNLEPGQIRNPNTGASVGDQLPNGHIPSSGFNPAISRPDHPDQATFSHPGQQGINPDGSNVDQLPTSRIYTPGGNPPFNQPNQATFNHPDHGTIPSRDYQGNSPVVSTSDHLPTSHIQSPGGSTGVNPRDFPTFATSNQPFTNPSVTRQEDGSPILGLTSSRPGQDDVSAIQSNPNAQHFGGAQVTRPGQFGDAPTRQDDPQTVFGSTSNPTTNTFGTGASNLGNYPPSVVRSDPNNAFVDVAQVSSTGQASHIQGSVSVSDNGGANQIQSSVSRAQLTQADQVAIHSLPSQDGQPSQIAQVSQHTTKTASGGVSISQQTIQTGDGSVTQTGAALTHTSKDGSMTSVIHTNPDGQGIVSSIQTQKESVSEIHGTVTNGDPTADPFNTKKAIETPASIFSKELNPEKAEKIALSEAEERKNHIVFSENPIPIPVISKVDERALTGAAVAEGHNVNFAKVGWFWDPARDSPKPPKTTGLGQSWRDTMAFNVRNLTFRKPESLPLRQRVPLSVKLDRLRPLTSPSANKIQIDGVASRSPVH